MINLQVLINEAVETNNQVKGGLRDGQKFHISDAGTCYRKRYLKRLGVTPTKKIEIQGLRKMVAGDAGHEKLQALLTRYNKLFSSEGEIETEQIKGHFDGIVKHDGSKAVVEFKTIEKWGMTHIKNGGAKPEHKIQLWTYWYYLRHDYTNLDQAILSYVKREDFEAHDIHYVWDDNIIPKVVEAEWKPLLDYWEKQQLPPCTCDKDYGGHGQKYCLYANEDGTCCSESLIEEIKK